MEHPPATTDWAELFARESIRLLSSLGKMTQGGIVEQLQHIGATSVPGLPADSCIDIGMAVWPFPLETSQRAVVEALGYRLIPGYEAAPEQRFRHITGMFQLLFVMAGSERWTDYVLMRDYLRDSPLARAAYCAGKLNQPGEGGSALLPAQRSKDALFEQLIGSAHQWWIAQQGFAPVRAVAQELKSLPHPWYISSGWALDLFLGRVTRVHHDVDVVVARQDQLVLQQHLTTRGWILLTPIDGRLEPWPSAMRLELPRHQVHAHRDGAFIDVLISDIGEGIWRYRRDPVVVRTIDRIGRVTSEGIPFLAPELVLLFKSKNTSNVSRDKDQIDFEQARGHLEPEQRAWLRWALLATDPTHRWIEQLI